MAGDRLEKVREDFLKIIEHSKNKKSEKFIREKFEEFAKLYPHLFKMALEGDKTYIETLDRMIEGARIVERGEVKSDDMDKIVGEELAKKYIYPYIDMKKESK